jgi:hypothetical protein
MRAAPTSIRIAWAAVFALLLAVRSLAPAGFMPAFHHGAVTIIACPDARASAPMPTHGHGEHKNFHQPCPYAAASALSALASGWGAFVGLVLLAALVLASPSLVRVLVHVARERPPARGPPLSA